MVRTSGHCSRTAKNFATLILSPMKTVASLLSHRKRMSFLVDKLVAGERIIPLRIAAVAISHLYGLVSWVY
jgi:hypothetical protein